MIRKKRGLSAFNFNVTGFDQNMSQANIWNNLLRNNDYKDQLIELIKDCILKEGQKILPRTVPFVITSKDKSFTITSAGEERLDDYNHEEADTRLVLHASKENMDVVIVSKDTDVLILMIWAFAKLKIKKKWYLKYDHKKFVDVGKIVEFLDNTLSLSMLTR